MLLNTVRVKFHKKYDTVHTPQKKHDSDAAYDLYSCGFHNIQPRSVTMVYTGLFFEIPEGWRGDIYSRSGLASKGIFVANQPGKIDSGYRGEICVLLYNSTDELVTISDGDRIAQFEVAPTYNIQWEEQSSLAQSERGEGGFGSTGV